MSRIRQRELHARRKRHAKLKHLRTQYAEAKNKSEKDTIIEHVRRVAPWLSEKEFTGQA